jgi:hypothetical protein
MHFQAVILFAQEKGKLFCIYRLESFKFNILMPTNYGNFKNIGGASRNDSLSVYIHLKSPKSRDTVPLSN